MQLTLFKALRNIKMSDAQATDVVEAIEEHIAVKVTEANKALEAKVDSVRTTMTVWFSVQTALLAVIGLAVASAPVWTKMVQ